MHRGKERVLDHKEFVDGYKHNRLLVYVNKSRAGSFVLSPLADKHNKPAHIFWAGAGVLLVFPIPLILLFINWIYSVGSIAVGLMVIKATRKSATEFVLQNMIEDEKFWNYVVRQGGVVIQDDEGNKYLPED